MAEKFSMISDLTTRQKNVLDLVIAFQQENRMAPTVREICAHLGLSCPVGATPGDGPRQPINLKTELLFRRAEIPSISRFLRSKTSI